MTDAMPPGGGHGTPVEAEPDPEQAPTTMMDTLDTLQKTHRCSLHEIYTWRSILTRRYRTIPESLKVDVKNFDVNDSPIPVSECDSTVTTPPPPDIVRTMYQLSTLDQKLVTVTLYFKHKANKGTLLAQGVLCPGWSEEEFHRLHSVITTIAASGPSAFNSSTVLDTLATSPIPFLGTGDY